MPRLQSPWPANATLPRRTVIAGAAALALSACDQPMRVTAATTPPLRGRRLNRAIRDLTRRAAPGVLGVGLINLESGEQWTRRGDRPFPMQSVFKLVLGAAVLAEVDAGRLSLEEPFVLEEERLSPPHSPIAEAWPARRDYTARQLLFAAVSDSDNTAADVLMRRVGGPGAVTAWLQSQRVSEIRIDRYERELQPQAHGMASFRPAWRGGVNFAKAQAAVPPAQRLAALRAYMADPRDTATPSDMLSFLAKLDAGELLTPASTRLLLQILTDGPRGGDRLKAGFPAGTAFAHKVGTSGMDLGLSTAFNDVGIFILPDRRRYAAAVFLSGSTLDSAAAAALFADIGRALVRGLD